MCEHSNMCVVCPILQCANIQKGDNIKDENQDSYGKDAECHIFEGMENFYDLAQDSDVF